jgi:hypothetical protein
MVITGSRKKFKNIENGVNKNPFAQVSFSGYYCIQGLMHKVQE